VPQQSVILDKCKYGMHINVSVNTDAESLAFNVRSPTGHFWEDPGNLEL
jgi:hypothetical protein